MNSVVIPSLYARIPEPNKVTRGAGDWYISYTRRNADGIVETAIVLGQCGCCLSLRGNHEKYLTTLSLDGCVNYFVANFEHVSPYSEHDNDLTRGVRERVLSDYALNAIEELKK